MYMQKNVSENDPLSYLFPFIFVLNSVLKKTKDFVRPFKRIYGDKRRKTKRM